MFDTVVLDGELSLTLAADGDYDLTLAADGEVGTILKVKEADPYTGETVITPTRETQVLATTGLMIPTDIIVKPIPSNYGLITWNGSTLTVS